MADQQVPVVDTEANQGGYALSGKIMLSAIVILFAVVVFMVGLHLYARWYLLRLRRRQLERRRQRRGDRTHHVVLYSEQQHPVAGADRGLEPAVLNSLPVFLHATKPDGPVQECAVCLSEFEEKEIVRLLPKCNHSFHIECIDMWFHSHSTCPLCRSAVEPVVKPVEPECTACSECGGSGAGDECATSSGGVGGRKGFEVRIEIPARRPADMVSELAQSSPAGRILSRIISMGRRSPRVSTTPSGAGPSCGPSGLDLESGSGRVLTPR